MKLERIDHPLASQRVEGEAALEARLERGRTRVARLFQQGAARIRLPARDADPLEAILINTAGGLTGGDRLGWRLSLGEGAAVVFTTQACEKVYRSSGGHARMRTDIRVGGERTVKAHASGKQAVSHFKPVQFFGKKASLVEVSLETGRTHQIRVHAAHAGYPLAGDEKYGDREANAALRTYGLRRMFLHSASIAFRWPDGGAFRAEAPLPPDLQTALARLAESPD